MNLIKRSIMTIETKYNIGDEVWFTFNRNPISSIISSIEVIEDGKIYYRMRYGCFCLPEHQVFPTEEELLKSL